MDTATVTERVPPVTFGPPGDRVAAVWVNGRPAGRIQRFQDTECWTYDHNGTSLVGPRDELQQQLRRHYGRQTG